MRTEEGKLYMFVAIDRTTKYVYVELHDRQTIDISVAFLKSTLSHFPYKINKILTDNGAQFTHGKLSKKLHPFDQVCQTDSIEHRLTLPYHPWTNGQVERVNRKLKDFTIKSYYYKNHDKLTHHLNMFIRAYNYGSSLKALNHKSPYEYILLYYEKKPEAFKSNPVYLYTGPYT